MIAMTMTTRPLLVMILMIVLLSSSLSPSVTSVAAAMFTCTDNIINATDTFINDRSSVIRRCAVTGRLTLNVPAAAAGGVAGSGIDFLLAEGTVGGGLYGAFVKILAFSSSASASANAALVGLLNVTIHRTNFTDTGIIISGALPIGASVAVLGNTMTAVVDPAHIALECPDSVGSIFIRITQLDVPAGALIAIDDNSMNMSRSSLTLWGHFTPIQFEQPMIRSGGQVRVSNNEIAMFSLSLQSNLYGIMNHPWWTAGAVLAGGTLAFTDNVFILRQRQGPNSCHAMSLFDLQCNGLCLIENTTIDAVCNAPTNAIIHTRVLIVNGRLRIARTRVLRFDSVQTAAVIAQTTVFGTPSLSIGGDGGAALEITDTIVESMQVTGSAATAAVVQFAVVSVIGGPPLSDAAAQTYGINISRALVAIRRDTGLVGGHTFLVIASVTSNNPLRLNVQDVTLRWATNVSNTSTLAAAAAAPAGGAFVKVQYAAPAASAAVLLALQRTIVRLFGNSVMLENGSIMANNATAPLLSAVVPAGRPLRISVCRNVFYTRGLLSVLAAYTPGTVLGGYPYSGIPDTRFGYDCTETQSTSASGTISETSTAATTPITPTLSASASITSSSSSTLSHSDITHTLSHSHSHSKPQSSSKSNDDDKASESLSLLLPSTTTMTKQEKPSASVSFTAPTTSASFSNTLGISSPSTSAPDVFSRTGTLGDATPNTHTESDSRTRDKDDSSTSSSSSTHTRPRTAITAASTGTATTTLHNMTPTTAPTATDPCAFASATVAAGPSSSAASSSSSLPQPATQTAFAAPAMAVLFTFALPTLDDPMTAGGTGGDAVGNQAMPPLTPACRAGCHVSASPPNASSSSSASSSVAVPAGFVEGAACVVRTTTVVECRFAWTGAPLPPPSSPPIRIEMTLPSPSGSIIPPQPCQSASAPPHTPTQPPPPPPVLVLLIIPPPSIGSGGDDTTSAQVVRAAVAVGAMVAVLALPADPSAWESLALVMLLLGGSASTWSRDAARHARYLLSPVIDHGPAAVVYAHVGVATSIAVVHCMILAVVVVVQRRNHRFYRFRRHASPSSDDAPPEQQQGLSLLRGASATHTSATATACDTDSDSNINNKRRCATTSSSSAAYRLHDDDKEDVDDDDENEGDGNGQRHPEGPPSAHHNDYGSEEIGSRRRHCLQHLMSFSFSSSDRSLSSRCWWAAAWAAVCFPSVSHRIAVVLTPGVVYGAAALIGRFAASAAASSQTLSPATEGGRGGVVNDDTRSNASAADTAALVLAAVFLITVPSLGAAALLRGPFGRHDHHQKPNDINDKKIANKVRSIAAVQEQEPEEEQEAVERNRSPSTGDNNIRAHPHRAALMGITGTPPSYNRDAAAGGREGKRRRPKGWWWFAADAAALLLFGALVVAPPATTTSTSASSSNDASSSSSYPHAASGPLHAAAAGLLFLRALLAVVCAVTTRRCRIVKYDANADFDANDDRNASSSNCGRRHIVIIVSMLSGGLTALASAAVGMACAAHAHYYFWLQQQQQLQKQSSSSSSLFSGDDNTTTTEVAKGLITMVTVGAVVATIATAARTLLHLVLFFTFASSFASRNVFASRPQHPA